jgi:nitroreductase
MDQLQNLMDILLKRRSIRVYDAEKPVEREKIDILLQAAMAAPSACNLQPWEFIIIDRPERMKQLKECIGESNGRYYNAPAAFVVCANTSYIPWGGNAEADTSAAIENMLLAITALGLGAVWLGDIDRDKIHALLDIPDHVSVNNVVLFGYPAETKTPRTQYNEEAIYWDKYDPKRDHPERTTALRFKP